ncbi:MAG: amidohydrolase [Chloroflexota bacterium]|nr:amidohydrolase [Chloroflexota bacterium]
MAGIANGGTMVDHVLTNARVHAPEVGSGPGPTAVAIRRDRIVAVGSDDDIRGVARPGTRVEDLRGATVIPGLIDAHNHLLATGQVLGQVSLYGCRDIAAILARVAEAVGRAAPGEWVLGRGWDESLLADGRHPTRHDLDRVAPDHPVVLHRVWNKLVANSAALRLAGITAATPDPPRDVPYAGWMERDAAGEPTGLFHDRAKAMVTGAIPAPTTAEMVAAIGRACRAYHAVGLTTVVDPGLTPDEVRAYDRAARESTLTIRADLLLAAWGFVPAEDEAGLRDRIGAVGFGTGFGDARLRLGGAKLMPDGGIGDRTAKLHPDEHYRDEPDNHGTWVIPPETIPEIVRWLHDHDLAIDSHTCGGLAQETIVRAYAAVMRDAPKPHLRHRVHHAYFPTLDTLGLMAEHGIAALVSAPFIRNLGESFVASLGEDRAGAVMPARAYLDAGITLAGTSDSPVDDFNPFVGCQALTTRQTITGRQFDPGQALTTAEALDAYTTGAARAIGREDDLGRIAPDYLADLVVLEPGSLDREPDELGSIAPLATMVGGEWVFDRR